MLYKSLLLFLCLFLFSCNQEKKINQNINIKFENKYTNAGFALIYNDDLENIKKLESRSLNIYHKSLKKR